jgi:hypothetical protein
MLGLPNFSTYQPPGVYWVENPLPTASGTGAISPSTLALVGPGIGYRTFVDTVSVNFITQTALSQLGINLTPNASADPPYAGLVVTNTAGSTTYTVGVDYTVTQNAATDGNAIDTTTTIIALSSGAISSGQQVVVSYQYTDSNYYSPTYCNDFPTIQRLFGPAFDTTTGAILSPLSFAAKFALDNGASQLVFCATTDPADLASRAGLAAAYTNLSALDSVGLVVSLPVGITGADVTNCATDLSTFLDNQVAVNNVMMFGLIGAETGSTINPITVSESVDDSRVANVFPNQMVYYNGFTNASQTVGGYYLAAALAGVLSSNPVQQGLTKQNVRDFSGISPVVYATMTTSYKNQLSAAGVCVVELTRQGVIQCRHGVTTDPTSVYTREISLVRSQDFMIETLLNAVDNAGLIGTPITGQTTATIQGLVTTNLVNLKAQGVIFDYNGINVTESTEDPTIINVTFQYIPSYPLNYITITFSINTTNGTVVTGGTNSGGSV